MKEAIILNFKLPFNAPIVQCVGTIEDPKCPGCVSPKYFSEHILFVLRLGETHLTVGTGNLTEKKSKTVICKNSVFPKLKGCLGKLTIANLNFHLPYE